MGGWGVFLIILGIIVAVGIAFMVHKHMKGGDIRGGHGDIRGRMYRHPSDNAYLLIDTDGNNVLEIYSTNSADLTEKIKLYKEGYIDPMMPAIPITSATATTVTTARGTIQDNSAHQDGSSVSWNGATWD